MAANFAKIIEDLESLTSAEKLTLVETLEERWGVESCYVAPGDGQADQQVEPVVEKTEFTVVLLGVGNLPSGVAASKVDVIKEVRKLTGLGLKESKEFVEACPNVVKADISKEEADSLVAQLVAAGAKVEVK